MFCKTCKYWDKYDTECNLINWIDCNKTMKGADFALYVTASDDQGLDAKFKCGPQFGCIKYLEK